MALSAVNLDDKYGLETGTVYITGTQALVRLPMMQRLRDEKAGLNTACYVSGYRGSPLGGLDQQMQRAKVFLDKHNIVFQPGINEDLAATAIWGSQQLNLFPNANYDGEQSFLTSLGDVVVTNTGFGYQDGDTVTVDGGITDDGTGAGTGTGTGVGTGTGGAEVELEIQDGRIIGAKVTNGGFGFTNLPDLTINSESGVGGRLLPVLNFTKVQDASKLVESVRQSAVTVISCITK